VSGWIEFKGLVHGEMSTSPNLKHFHRERERETEYRQLLFQQPKSPESCRENDGINMKSTR